MRLEVGQQVRVTGVHTAVNDTLTAVRDAVGTVMDTGPGFVTVNTQEGVVTLMGREVCYARPTDGQAPAATMEYHVAVYLWPDGEPSCWLTIDPCNTGDPWLLYTATKMPADVARAWINDWLNNETE